MKIFILIDQDNEIMGAYKSKKSLLKDVNMWTDSVPKLKTLDDLSWFDLEAEETELI